MSWLVSGTYSWSRSRSAASSGASHPIGCLQHTQTLLQGPCYRLLKPVQQCHSSLTSSQTAPCVRKLLRDHKTTFQTLLQRALLQTVQACATTPLQSCFQVKTAALRLIQVTGPVISMHAIQPHATCCPIASTLVMLISYSRIMHQERCATPCPGSATGKAVLLFHPDMLFVPSIVQEHARSHRTLQNITVYTVVTTDTHPCDKCMLHHSSCRSAVAAVAVPSQYLYYHNKRDSIPHAVLVLLGMLDNTWLKVCYRQAVRTTDWEAPAQRCSKP